MLLPVVVFSGIGVVAAVVLGIAARVFFVDEDPRIGAVNDLLPGANCGGCGFAGCAACAEEIVKGNAPANACVIGGTETANAVASFLGMASMDAEPHFVQHDCQGGLRAEKKYEYKGFEDCHAAMLYYHGQVNCHHGCLGFGSCANACKFNAIEMGENGLPVFYAERCVGCGACVRACPKNIIQLVTEKAKILHWNQYTECLAPCRQKCPAQINIPKYIQYIKNGDYDAALLTIKERNPMPLSIGRVCPEPCALACRRHIEDDPVAINYLKRFAADWEMNSGKRLHIPVAPDTGKRIAVIGGGPGGLTAAFFLRRLGHAATIYEMMPNLGGMLRYGIPEYRLPKKVLDWEIEGMLELGIDSHCNVEFGKDITAKSLHEDGYDAIFLAVGAWNEHTLKIEGADLKGVFGGIGFLQKFDLGNVPEIGEHVAVIGGGNTAVDVARSSLRQGAKKVTMVYRRSRDEMPANPVEIIAAEEEGIDIKYLHSPVKVLGENGRVAGMEIQKMKLGDPDPSGRRRPVPIEDAFETIECDMVVQAIGQLPEVGFMDEETLKPIDVTKWNTIDAAEDTLQTNVPFIFTGGDCFTGPGLVVEAIGAGRYAARSIHYFLTTGEIPPVEDRQREFIPESLHNSILDIEQRPKVHEPEIALEERLGTFHEVEGTISEEQAKYEANRCLNCGVHCYNHEVEGSVEVMEQKD